MKYSNLSMDLQKVINSCKDSAEIYLSAADNTKSEELQNIFLLFALQRKNFTELLYNEAQRENIRLSPNLNLFRVFQKLMRLLSDAFRSHNDERIITVCRQCEETLIDVYDEVLSNQDISSNLYKLLVEHQQLIRATMNRQVYAQADA